jgi:hypothetical protein
LDEGMVGGVLTVATTAGFSGVEDMVLGANLFTLIGNRRGRIRSVTGKFMEIRDSF